MSTTGRARGRSRGRARGADQPGQARRPGEPPAAAAPAPAVAVAAPQPPTLAATARAPPPSEPQAPPAPGRGRSRGGLTQAPAPGGGGAAAAGMGGIYAQLANLSIGGPQRSRFSRRDDMVLPIEPKTRPAHIQDKTGKGGQPIPLMTNFFRLNTRKEWCLYQYHVEFNPEIDYKNLRYHLLNEHDELLKRPRAFDGMMLFLPRRLEQKVTELTSTRRSDGAKINITITLTNELPPTSPTCLHLYNLIFRKILGLIDMKQIGRNYYNPLDPAVIPAHRLELWPGFVTSILQYETNVMLCADVSHKILRTDTVLDLLYEMYERRRGNFHDDTTKRLVGEIVLTRYNNKTYRIDDIDWNKNPQSKFQSSDGSELSYVEYYAKAYNKKITDLDQPLLVSKPKKRDEKRGMGPINLIPELCTLTGLTDEVRADFNVMKDIATHTRVAPDQRRNTLMSFMQKIKESESASKELSNWGLKFDDNLLRFQGRVVPPEKIYGQDKSFGYKPAEAEWSREMRGMSLTSCVNLQHWMLVFTRRDAPKAQDFLQNLMRVVGPMGMRVNPPIMCESQDDRSESYLRTIREQMNSSMQMVVCILPTNRKDRYDAIKKFCCVDHPVPSQVIVGRTLAKRQMLMSVATKIAMQLNCKLGGELWALEIPLSNTMVVGIDCYHDSATKGQSIGAFVASTNKNMTRFHSRVTFQHTGQELIDGLKVCLQASLKKYHEINKTLPERIFVYRDGVGDGQLAAVVEHEIPQLLDCFKQLGADYNPKVAVIIVKKRVNARFFNAAGHGLSNPPPGTIIDTEVTRPEWFDFYLVSQSVRQGTVTPTHYHVAWETTGLKPEYIQRLTYKLTHLYFNWPGTIRVPAPCQYAHKLAFLVGQSLHKEPNLALADRLYFL